MNRLNGIVHKGFSAAFGMVLLIGSSMFVGQADAANVSGLIPTMGTNSVSGSLTIQGQARTYVVIQPNKLAANAPAILMLHPHYSSGIQMSNLSLAGRLASTYGAVVLLPDALNGQWHDDPSPTGSEAGYPDDVAFLSTLIDTAVSQYKINPKRVYAAGYSNGGFMAERLACEITDKIAGIGAVAATLRDSEASVCRPTLALPVVLMMGTSDPVLPYNGIAMFESAAQAAQFWVGNDRCIGSPVVSSFPQVSGDPTSVSLARYGTCTAGSEVRFYTIQSGGHTWPGSPFVDKSLGNTTKAVDATLEIWKALSPYSLR